jgi:hypothetical protein
MKKLSEKQKARLQELTERNETLDQIIFERIEDHSQPLPLNLILETRFNELMKKGIALEGEIAYLKDQEELDEGTLQVKKRRLDKIKGQLAELQNVGDMLAQYHGFGREFEIVEI